MDKKVTQNKPYCYVENKGFSPQIRADITKFFTRESLAEVFAFHKSLPGYKPTPLQNLKELAHYLSIDSIAVKDESGRFGLQAFKGLGASYAVAKYLVKKFNLDDTFLNFPSLKKYIETNQLQGNITFASTTDGNHGKALAWMASLLGQKCVIHMPQGTTQNRLKAIADYGASVDILEKNYDECVRYTVQEAEENGWVVIQDTAWLGYEEIPLYIMQGYGSLLLEIIEAQPSFPFDTVFLQVGVGAYAGAIIACLAANFPEHLPNIYLVEPEKAKCAWLSIEAQRMTSVTGAMETISAGLACGEVNTLAWPLFVNYTRGSYACDDVITAYGMRILGNPIGKDQKIVSGESGAITTGLTAYLACSTKQLSPQTKVLVISTEGNTDPERYREIVWNGVYPLINKG